MQFNWFNQVQRVDKKEEVAFLPLTSLDRNVHVSVLSNCLQNGKFFLATPR